MTWKPIADMLFTRVMHTATLLFDGTVLVTGGAIAGSGSALVETEVYDVYGSSNRVKDLLSPRSRHTATRLNDGTVLVTGGRGLSNASLESAEIYNPSTLDWSPTTNMLSPRDNHTATLLQDGRVLVAGGLNNGIDLQSSEIFDPGTHSWSDGGKMASARMNYQATLLQDGRVLITGGTGRVLATEGTSTSDYIPLRTTEIYDPYLGAWSRAADMISPRFTHLAQMLSDGNVLVAGGYTQANQQAPTASAEIYDPAMNSWSLTSELNEPRAALLTASAVLGDKSVFVTGVRNESKLVDTSEVFDPGTGTWRLVESRPSRRSGFTTTLLADGLVLCAGGLSPEREALRTAEIYIP